MLFCERHREHFFDPGSSKVHRSLGSSLPRLAQRRQRRRPRDESSAEAAAGETGSALRPEAEATREVVRLTLRPEARTEDLAFRPEEDCGDERCSERDTRRLAIV
jgi:hypothetical protein